jgi:hypothetical protein
MKQSNAMNAIRFSFMFHQYNGGKIEGYDPGYILEKWRAHFGGLEPKEISRERHEELKSYAAISKWIDKWGEGSYTVMSRYLSIIIDINLLPMRIIIGEADYCNVPSTLIGIIEERTEGFADAALAEYRGLHRSLEDAMQEWIESKQCAHDMIQVNRRLALAKLIG